ncbi:hypothetical protein Mgra_00003771 [Meloidogyne graminicola]|uniref:Uncharacterized protein n=1 Tax=Meloidogyne graminicola TaxID=189291 RepID=A0A8S9ZU71_9BILA|nr:hypothetical protein Mgra_00003771 [Meloidogyne graminicola]
MDEKLIKKLIEDYNKPKGSQAIKALLHAAGDTKNYSVEKRAKFVQLLINLSDSLQEKKQMRAKQKKIIIKY